MAKAIAPQPNYCLTAAAFCFDQQKILLIKHKKLKIWLAPGGHLELPELTHETAIRELQEETGVKGEIISAYPVLPSTSSQNLPLPFSLNLHWISEGTYHHRLHSLTPNIPYPTKLWPLGCEQHLCFNYLVKPVNLSNTQFNRAETDALAWFSRSQIDSLDTKPDIKTEIHLAFRLQNI